MSAEIMALNQRISQLERHVERLERRLVQTMAFSKSTANPIDTGAVQTVQGRINALSVRDAMPVLMHYGFSSAMPIGGDKLVVFGAGEQSNALVIATGHQAHRFTGLATGESVLYDMWGHSIRMMQTEAVHTGDARIIGNLRVTGTITGGFGGADQVGLQSHKHGLGSAAAGTVVPTAGT